MDISLEGFNEYPREAAELYNRLRWWLGLTWGDLLDKAADLYPNKEALIDDRKRLTYAQVREDVDRLAVGLMDIGIGMDANAFPIWRYH